MSARRVTLTLTPAQLLCVNEALAYYEADDHDENYRPAVMDRTRRAVWDAMLANGIET